MRCWAFLRTRSDLAQRIKESIFILAESQRGPAKGAACDECFDIIVAVRSYMAMPRAGSPNSSFWSAPSKKTPRRPIGSQACPSRSHPVYSLLQSRMLPIHHDQVRRLLCHHDNRRTGMTCNGCRKDGRINNTESIYSMYFQTSIHDRVRGIWSHLCCTHGMVDRLACVSDMLRSIRTIYT